MIKMIALLKRRPDMTPEQFRTYYEKQHAKVGEAIFPGRAVRYFRRYFTQLEHPADTSEQVEPEFDAIMEAWFETSEAMHDALGMCANSPLAKYVVEDEKGLFDRDRIRMFCVEEEETDLSAFKYNTAQEAEDYLGIFAQEGQVAE